MSLSRQPEEQTYNNALYKVQGIPFIMLGLGSIELDRVIGEPCYKERIL